MVELLGSGLHAWLPTLGDTVTDGLILAGGPLIGLWNWYWR